MLRSTFPLLLPIYCYGYYIDPNSTWPVPEVCCKLHYLLVLWVQLLGSMLGTPVYYILLLADPPPTSGLLTTECWLRLLVFLRFYDLRDLPQRTSLICWTNQVPLFHRLHCVLEFARVGCVKVILCCWVSWWDVVASLL